MNMPHIEKSAPQDCVCQWPDGCLCPDAERALRAFASRPMPPMTPEQREECLEEIAQVEGYERADYENVSDAHLAQGVLDAWTDYCRDKGLL